MPGMKSAIPARFGALLTDFLRAKDIEPAGLIDLPVTRQADGEEFVSQPHWVQSLHRIAEFTNNPAVGLEIGAQIRPRHLGVAGYLLAHCANAGEMVVRLLHFSQLVMNSADTKIQSDGENGVLVWRADSLPVNQIWADLRTSATVTFCRNVTGLADYAVPCIEYALPAPQDLSPYTRFFGGKVLFDRDVFSIRVGMDMLSTPLIEPDPALVEALDEKADNPLRRLSAKTDLDEALYKATMQAINAGEPGAEAVAQRLSCSRRTLIRRMAKSGKTFQQVQDECRLELAKNYLADEQLSLADIAGLLGYTEQSAFSRAFRRWTGATPTQYRT